MKKALDLYRSVTPSLIKLETMFGLHPPYPIDHVAFRSFKSMGGIESIAESLGSEYVERDSYVFPEKNLTAKWYAPHKSWLPRVFASQLEDDRLSTAAQNVIHANVLPRPSLSYSDYLQLKQESEYGAWTLLHGSEKINHIGMAVSLFSHVPNMLVLHNFLEQAGFEVCHDGGSVKISDDGMLAQSSLVSDDTEYNFLDKDGPIVVPGTFVEFIDRRREGFEAGNAFHIFESTTKKIKD